VVVVGLGPSGAELVPPAASRALAGAGRAFVRTTRHPAVASVAAATPAGLESFDRLYDEAGTLDEVYRAIVEEVVAAAVAAAATAEGSSVAYAVPGSPFVAERTVALLRADDRVTLEIVPALSFVDLAWDRLGVDPVDAGVRLVDGASFAVDAAGERGPLLVAQCSSRHVLSTLKLAADDAVGEDPTRTAVLLHHLGLPDEQVREVAWADLDRTLEPDHLTAVWVPRLAVPVAAELVRLDELVHTLRLRCPWDRRQTHDSLARHLLEETYETLDAIDEVTAGEPDVAPEAVDHLEEELGDLLFQVSFHAVLASEQGRFTLADVARTVHDKLVRRHPHVFGDAVADTPDDVVARWEVQKRQEKGRRSVTDGIPAALPALALASKLQRQAESVGLDLPLFADRCRAVADGVERLGPAGAPGEAPDRSGAVAGADPATTEALGELLFALSDVARRLGADAEGALRSAAGRFRRRIEAVELESPDA
jgi:tetrapyrrole methylase family protein/MazG family protein